MRHCTNYRKLVDMSIITEIIIPPAQVRRLELYVIQMMFKYGGKGLSISMGFDDSMRIEAYFYDSVKRQKFCEMIDKAIDAVQPITVTPDIGEDDKEILDLKIDIKFMFDEFQAIMSKIEPVIQYIDTNGGWTLGINDLKSALVSGTLNEDVAQALNTFITFMGIYMTGSKLINNVTISHQTEEP